MNQNENLIRRLRRMNNEYKIILPGIISLLLSICFGLILDKTFELTGLWIPIILFIPWIIGTLLLINVQNLLLQKISKHYPINFEYIYIIIGVCSVIFLLVGSQIIFR